MLSTLDFLKRKILKKKISMVTCYDFWSAQILNNTDIDCLLVGDSLAMVMHGYDSTVHANPQMMNLHTSAVARGAKDKFIVADMPFLSFRQGLKTATSVAGDLIRSGAHSIKLEGVKGHEKIISHLVHTGIPVMGHLGLTPQSHLTLGGYKVQGKSEDQAKQILDDALQLESLGCFALVLECIPSQLANEITQKLQIPTIGIGAGPSVDGQVLVLHDLLGLQQKISPKFLRKFENLEDKMKNAVTDFVLSIHSGNYPSSQESYI